jgi:hypothetical protein
VDNLWITCGKLIKNLTARRLAHSNFTFKNKEKLNINKVYFKGIKKRGVQNKK